MAASEALFFTASTSYQGLQIHNRNPQEESWEEGTELNVEDLSDDDGRPFEINVLTMIYLGKRETA